MAFVRRITEILHDEHMATLALISSLEELLARGKQPPDVTSAKTHSVLKRLATAIEDEVGRHFRFEEDQLFARLGENGDQELGRELAREHEAILPLGQHLSLLAKDGLISGFSTEDWAQFLATGGEFVARLQPHVEKEEMSLLPVIDEIIDRESDLELCALYGGNA